MSANPSVKVEEADSTLFVPVEQSEQHHQYQHLNRCQRVNINTRIIDIKTGRSLSYKGSLNCYCLISFTLSFFIMFKKD